MGLRLHILLNEYKSMQRFKNILLVLNESHLNGPATQRAFNLAKSNNAKLTIIDVISSSPFGRGLHSFSDKIENLKQQLIAEREEELEKLISEHSEGLSIDVKVLSGKPFVEIIRYVLRQGCDLVVKAVEQEKRLTSMLFGSTDLRLLRKCPCPVWIVKPDDHVQTKKILAAVELETLEDEQELNRLNQQIIEIATSLAYRESGEIHIVNAWVVFDGGDLAKKLSKHYEEDASIWVEEQKKSIEKAQQALRGRYNSYILNQDMKNLNHSFHFIEGEAEEVIIDTVSREEIDLVVMGTVARTDLVGFLVGNTSEAVLNQINSSVLAIKPPGFISPVTLEDR